MLLDRVLLMLCLLLGLAQVVFAHGPAPVEGHAPGLVLAGRSPVGAIAYLPGGEVRCLAVRLDGAVAAVGMSNGTVRVFEAGTGSTLSEVDFGEAPHRLWLDHQGELLVAGPTRIRRYLAETGALLQAVTPGVGPATDTAYDPFNGALLRVTDGGLWQLALDDLARPADPLDESAEDLVVVASPHGDWVAAGGKERVARVRTATRVVETFERLGGWVMALEFLPDDRTLVVAGDAARIWLYDVVEGEVAGRVHGHRGWVNALAISPDGRWLAAAGSDETVRVYDLTTRRLRRRLEGHFEEIRALAFTPDGSMLLSGGDDQQLVVWDLATLELAASGS